VPHWYDQAGELLADPEIDAVYVASPPAAHLELGGSSPVRKTMLCREADGRFCADAQGLIDAFARAGLPLFPPFIAGPRKFRKVGELLAHDALGRVESVHYRLASGQHLTCDNWRLDPRLSVAAFFVDLGSHVLDLLDFLVRGPCGGIVCRREPKRSGTRRRLRQARLTGPGQPRIEIDFDFTRAGEPQDSCGSWEKRGPVFAVFTWSHSNGSTRVLPMPSIPSEDFSAEHVQQGLLENVMDCLRGKSQAWATPQAALRTWKLMETILKSSGPL